MANAIRLRHGEHGFTLVELMVGLVLGMVTVLLITQVLATSEGQSRTVASGSDAQVNGSLALFTMQRDVLQAGYGAVAGPDAMGCRVRAQYAGGAPFDFRLAPVLITDGTGGASDTITVLQGQSANFSTPIPVTSNHGASDAQFIVESALGVSAGDLMIVVPHSRQWETDPEHWWCTLFNVAADGANTLTPTRIPQAAGGWNQSAVMPAGQYTGSSLATQPRSYLLNMGAMVLRTYSVSDKGSLQMRERSVADGSEGQQQELFPQVATLQAMYGKDTNNDGTVDTYDNVTPTTNAGWLQVLAVRIAIVARSTQYEKEVVTLGNPLWDLGSTGTIGPETTTCPNGTTRCIALRVNTIPGWDHYRYKVYETIVPLRNVLWNS